MSTWKKIWAVFKPAVGPTKEGLVLAAGGARADFEVGALLYLYDKAHISPEVITGCSAGSMLASLLAQSKDPVEQRAILGKTYSAWRNLREPGEIFSELEWVTKIKQRISTWSSALEESKAEHKESNLASVFGMTSCEVEAPGGLLQVAANEQLIPQDGQVNADVLVAYSQDHDLKYAPAGLDDAELKSDRLVSEEILRHDKASLAAQTAASTEKTPAEEIAPGRSSSLTSMVRALFSLGITRIGDDIGTIWRGVTQVRAMYEPGPFTKLLRGPGFLDPKQLASSGVELRLAIVALESGRLRYITQTGQVLERDGSAHLDEKGQLVYTPIGHGIQASCTIPGLFKPQKIGAENYVDGGVREKLPIQVACEQLGANKLWVVATTTPELEMSTSYDKTDIVSVMLRSGIEIMDDEVAFDELEYARARGATIVYPRFYVHDSISVDPGLIDLSIDYGWARAAVACTKASAAEETALDLWIKARRYAWALEAKLFKPQLVSENNSSSWSFFWWHSKASQTYVTRKPTASELAELKNAKKAVQLAYSALPQRLRPAGGQAWGYKWERHPFVIPVDLKKLLK